MNIELQLNKDFERQLDALRIKYGEEFEYINGVHPTQLDYSEFLNNFVKQDTMADATIDPNANANHKDIRSFVTEKGKASDKLFGLNKIFLEIKKKWGLRTAKAWLEQEYSKGFYLNDSSSASLYPYCWANDLTRLSTEGLFFLGGYNNQAPKHLTTYFDDNGQKVNAEEARDALAAEKIPGEVFTWKDANGKMQSRVYVIAEHLEFKPVYSKSVETDKVEIKSGIRFGKTIGSPICIEIKNILSKLGLTS